MTKYQGIVVGKTSGKVLYKSEPKDFETAAILDAFAAWKFVETETAEVVVKVIGDDDNVLDGDD